MRFAVVFAVFLALLVNSCTIFKPLPAPDIYVIEPQINPVHIRKTAGVFYVKCANSSYRFNTREFFYKFSKYGFRSYAHSRWMDTPCRMVALSIIRALEKSGFASFASTGYTYLKPDYTLLFSIERLEPLFENRRAYVAVSIYVTLIDNRRSCPVISSGFSAREPVERLTMGEILSSMNRAVGDVIHRMLLRLGGAYR